MSALAIEVSLPLEQAPSGVASELRDLFLAGLNDRLADIGIRAEYVAAPSATDDVVVIGRVAFADSESGSALGAFEGDPVVHRGSSIAGLNHPTAATPIPSKTGGAA